MGWLIDWATSRIFNGWLDEIRCWEVQRISYFRDTELWVATDRCRRMDLLLEPGDMIPESRVIVQEFSSRKEAESFVDFMCARAAAIRLLKFWRD